MDEVGVTILFGGALAGALYSGVLSRIHHLYSPDYVWVTVVVGNALLAGLLALWLWLVPLPAASGAPLAAFWRLLALNVAVGSPVIAWQIGQAAYRHAQRHGGA